EFLVVAATLLDMKVAGLLPQGELVDAESVALLEARDLLFARLLQYRAFKEVSGWFAAQLAAEENRHVRSVPLDEKHRRAIPELAWTLTPEDFAALAVLAFTPKEIPHVGLDHLHAPLVSIREQAAIVVTLLRGSEGMTFRELVAGVDQPGVVVARFLSVLELYRHAAISFEQVEPLGELTLRWTAEHWSTETLATLAADYDSRCPDRRRARCAEPRRAHPDRGRERHGRGPPARGDPADRRRAAEPRLTRHRGGCPGRRSAAGHRGARRGLRRPRRRPAPRIRAPRGRGRLAHLRALRARPARRGVRRVAGAVPVVAGRAGDPGGDRVQAADHPRPGRLDPRGERRLGRAHAAVARAHHRTVHRCRD